MANIEKGKGVMLSGFEGKAKSNGKAVNADTL